MCAEWEELYELELEGEEKEKKPPVAHRGYVEGKVLTIDLDDTFWTVLVKEPDGTYSRTIASSCDTNVRRLTDGIYETDMCLIIVNKKVENLVKEAKRRGFKVAVVSQNSPYVMELAERVFSLEGIDVDAIAVGNLDKSSMFKMIADPKRIEKMVYVDDSESNLEDVGKLFNAVGVYLGKKYLGVTPKDLRLAEDWLRE
ncbi:MAG: hypothetical protein DRJ40_08415 [Thermoprotei archaeon]|nr:MAG: hypothetical protein DRJ40_08415 [Thermoprotei archaeon]